MCQVINLFTRRVRPDKKTAQDYALHLFLIANAKFDLTDPRLYAKV